MSDHILDELRRIRDEHAARFNYDVTAIFRDIKEQERRAGHRFVDGVARPVAHDSAENPVDTETALSNSLP
jgi:hypothetical protein